MRFHAVLYAGATGKSFVLLKIGTAKYVNTWMTVKRGICSPVKCSYSFLTCKTKPRVCFYHKDNKNGLVVQEFPANRGQSLGMDPPTCLQCHGLMDWSERQRLIKIWLNMYKAQNLWFYLEQLRSIQNFAILT